MVAFRVAAEGKEGKLLKLSSPILPSFQLACGTSYSPGEKGLKDSTIPWLSSFSMLAYCEAAEAKEGELFKTSFPYFSLIPAYLWGVLSTKKGRVKDSTIPWFSSLSMQRERKESF